MNILAGALLALLLVFLSAFYNHADYLYQAKLHGWPSWWKLTANGRTWWFFRFDWWHRVQNIRNHAWVLSAVVSGVVVWECLPILAKGTFGCPAASCAVIRGIVTVFSAWLVHGIGRAIGFTFVKLHYTGKW